MHYYYAVKRGGGLFKHWKIVDKEPRVCESIGRDEKMRDGVGSIVYKTRKNLKLFYNLNCIKNSIDIF